MLILDINNLKKYYGYRLILDIKDLKVYSGDKIGLVGLNGSGKTTLLNLISKEINPEEGTIRTTMEPFYIKQLEDSPNKEVDKEYMSKFGLKDKNEQFMSGGELTRLKIAKFLTDDRKFLLADEPTSNLDFEGINLLIEKLSKFDGSMIITSHDRDLLDKVCNKIIEIEDGKIKIYEGNYSDYKAQKELEKKTQELEYEKYIREKERLQKALIDTKQNLEKIRTTPKRMGNSEARLHKMGGQVNRKKQDNKVKAIAKRIEKLEVKDKVKELEKINLDIRGKEIFSKIVIEGKDITKAFGKRILFKNSDFQIYNKSKVGLIGDNGTGKTTLLKMILENAPNINISKKANIGYFSQNLNILDENKSIIENLLELSCLEQEARDILARFLFKRDDVYKKVSVLSGGEKVKVSLAKILLNNFNILILDEPTNYLDIYSIEAVEEALINYDGTLLFVSHDRRLIEKVADTIMVIENNKINTFQGTFNEYNNKALVNDSNDKDLLYRRAILENKLSEVIGLLSISKNDEEKEKLDLEYQKILKELNEIK
ncbi:ribosomal protection-like ABC-F family protein [uncultured Tissierella sp.]|uniref:ribosomal protection-like ABC-F family protein n=1 Tax=uncultured Tissierella sp. TaxID=448160 RepID=UPI002804C711|nr:ABC-F type ribosomal protection protein [uncultured Tissierella sp.]MDU5081747.1 ABC-F type ribosomal protection protein [Bacillota bacterium]